MASSETGLYYYRARYCDPSTGRFVSEDPLRFKGDVGNFYEYSYSDPTNFIDPYGMSGEGSGTTVANPPTTGAPGSGKPSSPPRSFPPPRSGPGVGPEPVPPAGDGFPWGGFGRGLLIGIAIELLAPPATEVNDVIHLRGTRALLPKHLLAARPRSAKKNGRTHLRTAASYLNGRTRQTK